MLWKVFISVDNNLIFYIRNVKAKISSDLNSNHFFFSGSPMEKLAALKACIEEEVNSVSASLRNTFMNKVIYQRVYTTVQVRLDLKNHKNAKKILSNCPIQLKNCNYEPLCFLIKFSFSKKATKFETIFHLIWRLLIVKVKSSGRLF